MASASNKYNYALEKRESADGTLNQLLTTEPYEQEIDIIHGKRKDLFLIALLQYICEHTAACSDGINKNKFMDIVKTLMHTRIIDPELAHPKYESLRKNIIRKIQSLLHNQSYAMLLLDNDIYDANNIYHGLNFIQKINQGAYGTIYEARSTTDGQNYAIKKTSYVRKAKWDNEVKIMSQLDHLNIVRYYNSWIDTDHVFLPRSHLCDKPENGRPLNICLYIQMELLDVTVDQLIKTYTFSERIEHIHSIFKQLLDAMSYIHNKNIAHGDLKPSNIMIKFDCSDENDIYIVKITDFGSAKYLSHDTFDQQRLLSSCSLDDFDAIGTPLYVAPEIENHDAMSPKSDVYSLGVILFEFITDFEDKQDRINKIKNIYENLSTISYSPAIKKYIVPIIQQMIAIDPHDRPTCCKLHNIWNTPQICKAFCDNE